MNRMSRLILVRHAETSDNANLRLSSRNDVLLTERGKLQARLLAETLSAERLAAVYSSPLSRARQTAEEIAAPRKIGVTPLEELAEVHIGKMHGLTHEDLEKRYPHFFAEFFAQPDKRFPEGECLEDVQNRALPVIEKLFSKHENESFVVVAHNVVNRVLLASLTGVPLGNCRVFKQTNACVNVLTRYDGEGIRLHSIDNSIHSLGR